MWADKRKIYTGRIYYDWMSECWRDQENDDWVVDYTPEDGVPEARTGFDGLETFYNWVCHKPDDKPQYQGRIYWDWYANPQGWTDIEDPVEIIRYSTRRYTERDFNSRNDFLDFFFSPTMFKTTTMVI